MDEIDRVVIDVLQDRFPVCERPFLAVAQQLDMSEAELIARVDRMLQEGTLTRFGPLFAADRLGGELTLCAMQVPRDAFDDVAGRVNALAAVAHNYERDNELNMWFVLATETVESTGRSIAEIEQATGLPVHAFPKEREYFVGLELKAAT
jgi:DNA-binding Lrp family transcriptional regulator